jgi:hypothetical protein
MDGKWIDCGNPVVEKAWEEYQAVVVNEMTLPTIPQVTRALLTKSSGRPESTLQIHTANSTVNSGNMMFVYVSDPSNLPCVSSCAKWVDTSALSQKTILTRISPFGRIALQYSLTHLKEIRMVDSLQWI